MFGSVSEALEYIRENDISLIDLKIGSLAGEWLHISIPSREFGENYFQQGVGFDGSSVRGFGRLESGDLAAVPDPATGFLDPFYEKPTLSFICDTVTADTKEPYGRSPRAVARRAERYLADSDTADAALFAPEFEFNIFDRVKVINKPFHTCVRIAAGETREQGGSYGIPAKGGYLRTPPLEQLHILRSEIVAVLENVGVPVHYHHHEVGAAGQCEIEVSLDTLTRAADKTMLIKYVVKNVARRRGKLATFMPKPIHGEPGNGMHVHQMLGKAGRNLFYDPSPRRYANLSEVAFSYIGGLLRHGPALTGLTNPSTNSFKRLVEGFEAPVSLFFSLANRSAAVRVPKYAVGPEEKRIEYRPPDFTGNVYLTLAGMLMAGIDGVTKKIDPTAAGFGPFDVDISQAQPELRGRITPLPLSVEEALRALSSDRQFLLAGGVFGDDLIDAWMDLRLSQEVREVRHRPHPYEYYLYLDA